MNELTISLFSGGAVVILSGVVWIISRTIAHQSQIKHMDEKIDHNFNHLNEKIDRSFNHLNEKMDSMFSSLREHLDYRFRHLEDKIDNFEVRLSRVESYFGLVVKDQSQSRPIYHEGKE